MASAIIVGLVVAFVTLIWVAYRARRRVTLTARFVEAATGTLIVSIFNLGRRSVRIERIIRREGWVRRHDHDFSAWSGATDSTPLPVTVMARHNVFVPIHNIAGYASRGRWFLVDADGHRHAIRSHHDRGRRS